MNQKAIEAIEQDLLEEGLDADVIKRQLAKMLPTDAITGEEEVVYTAKEVEMMKEFRDEYNRAGNSLRAARRKMDKKYGVGQTFTQRFKANKK